MMKPNSKILLLSLTLFLLITSIKSFQQNQTNFFESNKLGTQLPPFPSVSNLPYQAHSFNDINYILQLMKRGVKYFKIDVSLANYQSCAKNSNWNKSQPCYKTNQYAQQYCCLALRGDTSGRNSFNYNFNTLQQFIDMIQKYLSTNSINQILFFAINHQFHFSFDNALAENTIFRLAKLMNAHPKLYFGFGSDDFILEYDRICKNSLNQNNKQEYNLPQEPLKKLNSQQCTQQRKYISKSRFFLQSGADNPSDPRDYYSRYRNFNTYYKEIVNRCNRGFPNWVKKYPQFPLIFWQPSNQRQIQLVLQLFMSQKCRLHHGRDLKGLAITSNIDPQVFQFYLKNLNQQTNTSSDSFSFLPNSQKIVLSQKLNLLTKIKIQKSEQNKLSNGQYMILGQISQLNRTKYPTYQLQASLFYINSSTQKVQQKMKKNILKIQNKTITKIVGESDTFTVVTQDDIEAQYFVYNSDLNQTTSLSIPDFIYLTSYRSFYYTLRRTSNPTVLNLIKSKLDFSTNSIISSFSLSLEKSHSLESFTVFEDQNQIFRIILSGTFKSQQVWIAQVRNQQIYTSINITWGMNSKLTLKQSGSIILSVQNGPCNSGVLINNGDTPQCAYFKYPQFSSLKSTEGSINFIEFTFEHLIEYIQSFGTKQIQPVTPCTNNFVVYKSLNGRNSNIVQIWSKIFIVSEYVHISQLGLLNSLFCAPSNFNTLKYDKKAILGTIWSRNQFQNHNKFIMVNK